MIARLVSTTIEAQDTMTFKWYTDKKVTYFPGQFMYFTIPTLIYPDKRGNTRHFTLSSSPTEKYISNTTRIRKESGYKQTLAQLKKGDKIEVEGPSGTFIVDEEEKGPHVFIAGGIGITPFRSMLKYKMDKNLKYNVQLIYSNSIPELIAFRKEIEEWDKKSNTFNLTMTISSPEKSQKSWKGETGRIDNTFLEKNIDLSVNPKFWVCGPPGMVDSIEISLISLGIRADDINSDKFTGY